MGAVSILQVIFNGFFVCICKVYSDITKTSTSHAFACDIHVAQKDKSKCCGALIYNISHTPICVLEENIGK